MTASKQPSPRGSTTHDRTKRPNTVGLDQRRLSELLDQFDALAGPGKAQRDFKRFPFRHTSLKLEIVPPTGPPVALSVATRNISRGGMGIMHSAYMHQGTECIVHLPRVGKDPLKVQASVVRCTHRAGVLHEIGLNFATPVELRDLLCPDPFAECFSLERVQPARLVGTIVYADASGTDQEVFRHFLRDTTLAVRVVESVGAAAAAAAGAELVIAEYDLPDGTADQILAAMRAVGNTSPFVVATSQTEPATRARIALTDADAFLTKPLRQETLLRAIGEVLLLGKEDEMGSDNPEASPAAIHKFLRDLRRHSASLESAARCGDAAAVREVCRQIAKAAPRAGMNALTKAAADVPETGRLTPDCLGAVRAEITRALGQAAKKAA